MTDVNQLITAHLDIWTSAIEKKPSAGRGDGSSLSLYGVKKLRELILDLAVRGKLVAQEEREGHGQGVLGAIAKHRRALLSSGAIKKPRQRDQNSEVPFDVPDNWVWAELDDLTPWQLTDGDWIEKKDQDPQGGVRLIQLADVGVAEFLDKSDRFVNEATFERLKCTKLEEDDILIARLPNPIGRACTFPDIGQKAITAVDVAILRATDEISRPYLVWAINSRVARLQVESFGKGATRFRISTGNLKTIKIPVPPLSEQIRIAAKVDELMALCDALERQTEDSLKAHQTLVETCLAGLTNSQSAEDLTQNWNRIEAHFDTLFSTQESIAELEKTILELGVSGKLVEQIPDESDEPLLPKVQLTKAELLKKKKAIKPKKMPEIAEQFRPKNLPAGWVLCQLQELIVSMDAGWSPACPAEPSPADDVWGVLKTTAVQPMLYWEHENKVLPDKLEPREQYEVQAGDILITRAGPKNRVAICCAVESTRPRLMISDKIIRFHLVEDFLSSRFIAMTLNTENTAAYLESAKSGMAESQMNISQDKLKAAPISLPPLEEQERIVRKVDELLAACDALRQQLPVLNDLRTNLANTLTAKIH